MVWGKKKKLAYSSTYHALPDSPAVSADRGPAIRRSHADFNATYIKRGRGIIWQCGKKGRKFYSPFLRHGQMGHRMNWMELAALFQCAPIILFSHCPRITVVGKGSTCCLVPFACWCWTKRLVPGCENIARIFPEWPIGCLWTG